MAAKKRKRQSGKILGTWKGEYVAEGTKEQVDKAIERAAASPYMIVIPPKRASRREVYRIAGVQITPKRPRLPR